MTSLPFSYTQLMELILIAVSNAASCLFLYLAANPTLAACEERIAARRKVYFVILLNTCLMGLWVYGIFLIRGMRPFTDAEFASIVLPNPVLAMAVYYSELRILKLDPVRASQLINYVYLFSLATAHMNLFITHLFPARGAGAYNQLCSALPLIVSAAAQILWYYAVRARMRRSKAHTAVADKFGASPSPPRLRTVLLENALFYASSVALSFAYGTSSTSHAALHAVAMLAVAMCLRLHVMGDRLGSMRREAENMNVYIRTLTSALEDFRGLKHDFYNILQTYEGYLTIGNLDSLKLYHETLLNTTMMATERIDLNKRMYENPPLITTLLAKLEAAGAANVNLRLSVTCDLVPERIGMDSADTCRVIAGLLDLSIDSASASQERRVTLSLSRRDDGSLLIVCQASAPAKTIPDPHSSASDAPGPHDAGPAYHPDVSAVRKTLERYANTVLYVTQHAQDYSIFVEIPPAPVQNDMESQTRGQTHDLS